MSYNTKDDYANLLNQLLNPLEKYYSEGKSQLHLGTMGVSYSEKTVGFEGFARVLWGLVPLLAGGGSSKLSEQYIEGIRNGINPEHMEYWGKGANYNQIFVEMAPLAIGILIAPEYFLEPLNSIEKKRLANWFDEINHYKIPKNNWQFFLVFANLARQQMGYSINQEKVDNAFDIIERSYIGDGWYSDGVGNQRDYYVAFAMHFYGLIYAKIMPKEKRSNEYKNRAALFAKDYIYYFAKRGDAVPFGRSLTYRFAQAAFWSALVYADVEAFEWGVIKGIISRNLSFWMKQSIFSRDGILSVGYIYPNMNMAEGYNSLCSPLWALKTFFILAVPNDHPFWNAEIKELPKLDKVKILPHAYSVISHMRNDHVLMLTSGQYANFEPAHVAEKYSKFAYSNYFGFSVPRSYYNIEMAAPDNMLVVIDQGMCRVRGKCLEYRVEENTIISKWTPQKGIEVETKLYFHGNGYIREHMIWSELTFRALDCGFCLPLDENTNLINRDNCVALCNNFGCSAVKLLEGEGVGISIWPEPNTNLVHPTTVLPCIEYEIKKGRTKLVCLTIATKDIDVAKQELKL